MTSSSVFEEDYKLLERCNHSELYQIARRNRLVVFPNLARDALIKIIIGQEDPPPIKHELDEWRLAIMRFIIDHRRVLETQIACPAKSFKEDACFGCIDAQVVSCLSNNGKENQKLIQLRKK